MFRVALFLAISGWISMAGCVSAGDAARSPESMESTAVVPAATSPSSVASGAEVTQSEYSNTLRWSTASEVDNFGFDVYRAGAEEGPFVRLTSTPVLGAGTSDLPSEYQYRDATIDPRRPYFYYVESIAMTGVRERFTPIIRAAPKVIDEGEADSSQ